MSVINSRMMIRRAVGRYGDLVVIFRFSSIKTVRLTFSFKWSENLIAKNKIISKSNTSVFIVDNSRLHVSTLIGSSSGLFETSL